MSTFNLDSASLTTIASAAIFDSLSQEVRDDIIKQAVAYLITPNKDSYGRFGKSPLQEAFERGIYGAANDVVRESLKSDPQIKEKIKELLGPFVDKAVDVTANNYDSSLTEAIGTAFGNWLENTARERSGR